jgi:type IV pilus assembly protein PilA
MGDRGAGGRRRAQVATRSADITSVIRLRRAFLHSRTGGARFISTTVFIGLIQKEHLMLARMRKSTDENDQGFTLIELLVVMIIIGILAAIAIPVFLSQRQKARDTAVKADVSTLGKEIATYYVDGTGIPAVTMAASRYLVNGSDVGKISDVDTLISTFGATYTSAATTTTGWTSAAWCVAVYNASGAQKVYKYSAQNGLEAGNCTNATTP